MAHDVVGTLTHQMTVPFPSPSLKQWVGCCNALWTQSLLILPRLKTWMSTPWGLRPCYFFNSSFVHESLVILEKSISSSFLFWGPVFHHHQFFCLFGFFFNVGFWDCHFPHCLQVIILRLKYFILLRWMNGMWATNLVRPNPSSFRFIYSTPSAVDGGRCKGLF